LNYDRNANDCVSRIGTLLASGSDDLNIIVWKWAESKQFFTFDSGHRSNVFQVRSLRSTSIFTLCSVWVW